ncbi:MULTISPECIES: non-ribosomal peptide synthetase [Actinosynnema]|uniref:non-ribosomal peptide synthetase n=1 Tax=Actinosynnema TaxID=40566 RepID=UPI0020A40B03|nr:non-ribosomal peptide synthetase [Actinosynnema pretiosum]
MSTKADVDLARRSNSTAVRFARADALLHELFLDAARTHAGRTAVAHPEGALSYAELADRASAAAHRLRDAGVATGDVVAIVMEKGWEQVVAALGALMAGAVFVPVDPANPAERLHHLLEHSLSRAVLTQPALVDRLPWPEGLPVQAVDAEAPATPQEPPTVHRGPDDLAYVIYTSGSTGLPKGVMISHRGAVNTILDINSRFDVGPDDRVLALSALSFDLAIYDVFGTLATGAAIVVPKPSARPDPVHWAGLVAEAGVTVWNSVPALMELAVAAAKPGQLDPLRLVLLSGDWIRVGLPADVAEANPRARVISLGGATEGSIWSILRPVDEVDPAWPSIPYGRPMANQTFHVLDKAMAPCPVGVPGELHIGGAGVALGYWRDPERTAARFVTLPATGERVYRTGDLGRYLPDGEIQFLGRDDFQVKVQGFRIELGEVEAALRGHPGVQDAVTVAERDAAGSGRLVSFVLAEDAGLDGAAVRAHAAASLPPYMVPSAVVVVTSWPLTDNGKVDRGALLRAVPREGAVSRAPEGPLEELLAGLWAEVLTRDEVGVEDDFFALGGQSLLATRMVLAVNALFDVEVPVRAVFEAPTVAAFRGWLAEAGLDVAALEAAASGILAGDGQDDERGATHPVGR